MLSLPSMGQQLHTLVTHHEDLVVALILHHLYPVTPQAEAPPEGTPGQGQPFPLSPPPLFPWTSASAAYLSSSSPFLLPRFLHTSRQHLISPRSTPKLPTLPTNLLPSLLRG